MGEAKVGEIMEKDSCPWGIGRTYLGLILSIVLGLCSSRTAMWLNTRRWCRVQDIGSRRCSIRLRVWPATQSAVPLGVCHQKHLRSRPLLGHTRHSRSIYRSSLPKHHRLKVTKSFNPKILCHNLFETLIWWRTRVTLIYSKREVRRKNYEATSLSRHSRRFVT